MIVKSPEKLQRNKTNAFFYLQQPNSRNSKLQTPNSNSTQSKHGQLSEAIISCIFFIWVSYSCIRPHWTGATGARYTEWDSHNMSNRRGAPSMDKECVIRRKWYAEAQKKEFRGSDSSSSDDEAPIFEEAKIAERKSPTEEKTEEKEVKEIKKKNVPPPSTFTNFASTLGSESRWTFILSIEQLHNSCHDLYIAHSQLLFYNCVYYVTAIVSSRRATLRRLWKVACWIWIGRCQNLLPRTLTYACTKYQTLLNQGSEITSNYYILFYNV